MLLCLHSKLWVESFSLIKNDLAFNKLSASVRSIGAKAV